MGKKGLRLLAYCMIPAILTGCRLLPEEEVLPAVRPLYVYEAEAYQQVTVMRGNLEKIDEVDCSYEAVNEEIVGFSMGDMYVEQVLVRRGQKVLSGELLATLEQTDIQQQIAQLEYQLEVLQLKLVYLLDTKMLEIADCEVRWNWDQVQEKRDEIEKKYAAKQQDMEDEIYIQTLMLEEKKAELAKRQLFAGINGTVTYVKELTTGLKSVKDEGFVRIVDFDSAVFKVKGKQAAYFPVGTQATVTNRLYEEISYSVISVDPSELGIESTDEQCAYLKLVQPDPELEDGTPGVISIVLEQKSNVLYVDKKAVRTSNGEPFVYICNEDGLREVRKIVTGLETDDFLEIKEGLQEGDKVILK